MLEISAPEDFPIVVALAPDGPLAATPALQDPRRPDFAEREVVFDLRACLYMQFPAALWCLVYGSLARQAGANCLLLPPRDPEAAGYLQEVGFFKALREAGVVVEEIEASQPIDSVVALPITRFGTINGVEDLAEEALREWDRTGRLAANLRIQASERLGSVRIMRLSTLNPRWGHSV